jgi:hypothetical protein
MKECKMGRIRNTRRGNARRILVGKLEVNDRSCCRIYDKYSVVGTMNAFKDSGRSLTAIDRLRVESSVWLL